MLTINNTGDLHQLPAVLVAYEAGSSGEFLGWALSQSFDGIAKQPSSWVGQDRVSFKDLFGKKLANGDVEINIRELFNKINYQLPQHPDNALHVGLVHPRPYASVRFVNQYMPNLPMIQIVCYQMVSKQFRTIAASFKLSPGTGYNKFNFFLPNEMAWADQFVNPKIKVEWLSLFMTNTQREFQRIEEFLGQTGNFEVFQGLVDDYLARNQEILQLL